MKTRSGVLRFNTALALAMATTAMMATAQTAPGNPIVGEWEGRTPDGGAVIVLTMADGQQAVLVQTPRSIRGGLSFIF